MNSVIALCIYIDREREIAKETRVSLFVSFGETEGRRGETLRVVYLVCYWFRERRSTEQLRRRPRLSEARDPYRNKCN